MIADPNKLKREWEEEEKIAYIHGWDFSHIAGRSREENDLPWDYEQAVRSYLTPETKVLDIDTGGGEFLLSLGHPYGLLSATEGFAPNVELCKETLLPLGVDLREADSEKLLPFTDESFDLVIDRHGSYNEPELYRVLKPGGTFVTQQVGAENERELVSLLLGDGVPIPFPEQYLETARKKLEDAGFRILQSEEAFRSIRFFDVGALVWFARIISWEFPGFSVETHFENLCRAQELLEKTGEITGTIHRYFLVARK